MAGSKSTEQPVELSEAELSAQRADGIPGPDSNDELRKAAEKRSAAEVDRGEQPRAAEGAASRGQVDR